MTICIRCGDYSAYTYCSHCRDKVYELNEQWRELMHELTEDVCSQARTAFQNLAEKEAAPGALEVLAEALHAVDGYTRYNRELAQIWEGLIKPDPREFPTQREMAEAEGDRKYHEMKEEGSLRGRY